MRKDNQKMPRAKMTHMLELSEDFQAAIINFSRNQ